MARPVEPIFSKLAADLHPDLDDLDSLKEAEFRFRQTAIAELGK
jgi:hypothetical protein